MAGLQQPISQCHDTQMLDCLTADMLQCSKVECCHTIDALATALATALAFISVLLDSVMHFGDVFGHARTHRQRWSC